MFIMYVDETRDPGLVLTSPTDYYILSGLIVNEREWNDTIQNVIDLRRFIKDHWAIKQRAEYKGANIYGSRGDFYGVHVPPADRMHIYEEWINLEAKLPIRILNVCFRKVVLRSTNPDYPVYEGAWRFLIQRFNNFLERIDSKEHGIIIADEDNEKIIRKILRMMKVYNPIPKRYKNGVLTYFDKPIHMVIEDPVIRDSKHSYFVQLADLNAYALLRWELGNCEGPWVGLNKFFEKLDPVLLKAASLDNPWGIVYYPKK
jgi:hypothetical protein